MYVSRCYRVYPVPRRGGGPINQHAKGRILEAIVVFLAFALVNATSQAFQVPLFYYRARRVRRLRSAFYHVMAEQLSLGDSKRHTRLSSTALAPPCWWRCLSNDG